VSSTVYAWVGSVGNPYASSTAACGGSTGGPVLYTSTTVPIALNVTRFFTNNTFTTPVAGNDQWYRLSTPSNQSTYAIQIDNNGYAIATVLCSGGGS
jgi:hypothetical protein